MNTCDLLFVATGYHVSATETRPFTFTAYNAPNAMQTNADTEQVSVSISP